MRMSHPVLLAASVAALRAAAPRRTPLTLRKASAADAIRDALSFAQRASPATADDRLAHSMRARDLTEDELRAVLVGRGVDEAATADVPRGILADLLGELRAADDARSAAKALGTAPSAPRESLLPSLDASPPPTLRDVVAPDALRQGLGTAASAAASAAAQIGLGDVVDDATRAAKNVASSALRSDAAAPVRRAATQATLQRKETHKKELLQVQEVMNEKAKRAIKGELVKQRLSMQDELREKAASRRSRRINAAAAGRSKVADQEESAGGPR